VRGLFVSADDLREWTRALTARHCKEQSNEEIQTATAERLWIASLRSL